MLLMANQKVNMYIMRLRNLDVATLCCCWWTCHLPRSASSVRYYKHDGRHDFMWRANSRVETRDREQVA